MLSDYIVLFVPKQNITWRWILPRNTDLLAIIEDIKGLRPTDIEYNTKYIIKNDFPLPGAPAKTWFFNTVVESNRDKETKKAKFEYEILDTYDAGIMLVGTEIKSIREGKATITESFCEFNDRAELFVINMYEYASLHDH